MSLALSNPRHLQPVAVGNPLVPRDMAGAMQLAEMMSRSKIGIPEHLRGNPGDCLMVIEVATRWNMSPFAVAQCTNNVKGKLGYEGKIIHAAIESSGVADGYVDYEFSGEGDARSIRVFAKRRGESEPRDVTVKLADAKTNNEWWKKTPDQMLVYHGARVWARRWTPGVLLGVYAPEEFDAAPRDPTPYTGPTIEAERETPIDLTPPPTPRPSWLQKFEAKVAGLTDRAACFSMLDEGTEAKRLFNERLTPEEQSAVKKMLAARVEHFLSGPSVDINADADDAGEP